MPEKPLSTPIPNLVAALEKRARRHTSAEKKILLHAAEWLTFFYTNACAGRIELAAQVYKDSDKVQQSHWELTLPIYVRPGSKKPLVDEYIKYMGNKK